MGLVGANGADKTLADIQSGATNAWLTLSAGACSMATGANCNLNPSDFSTPEYKDPRKTKGYFVSGGALIGLGVVLTIPDF